VKVRLDVRVQGQLVHSDFQKLDLQARKVRSKQVDGKDIQRGEPDSAWAKFEIRNIDMSANPVVHAYLDGVKDHFPLDDEAWLILSPSGGRGC